MSETVGDATGGTAGGGRTVLTVVAWVWVTVPFLYGVGSLLGRVGALF